MSVLLSRSRVAVILFPVSTLSFFSHVHVEKKLHVKDVRSGAWSGAGNKTGVVAGKYPL